MSMSEQKIPLILICGFLGSGKTTLVNRLLREGFDGERVAIVVNDFGSVAIDEALIDHAGEGMLALTNGCICCTLASDLVQGLKAMLDTGRYERIVMETSGVTAVKSLLEALAWPGLANRLELERIITVVDAARYPKIHRVVRVVDEQVHHADVIVMNYIDYAKPEQREHTENSLREINPGAPVIRTSHSQVTREQLAIASRTEKAILAGKVSDDWFTCRVAFEQPVTRERLELALGALPAHLQPPQGLRPRGNRRHAARRARRRIPLH